MPVPEGTKAGKISKPYGLRGDVYLILNPVPGTGIKVNDPLFINIDGQRVPYFVEDYDRISNDQAIVKFEFINSLEEARKICGYEVYTERRSRVDPVKNPPDYHGLIGFSAFDSTLGLLGPVTDFLPGDKNPVLIVGYRGKELIIPAVDAIIRHINMDERTIHFDLPEGLTEL